MAEPPDREWAYNIVRPCFETERGGNSGESHNGVGAEGAKRMFFRPPISQAKERRIIVRPALSDASFFGIYFPGTLSMTALF